MIRNIAFAIGLGLVPAAVMAQDAPDADAAYQAARNQLGILQYCQDQGFTGPEAVVAQGELVGMLPQGDEATGAAAEEKGMQGTISVGDTELTLADAVESRGSTVEDTCKQIEAAVNEVAPATPTG